jgi:hypothetical protein
MEIAELKKLEPGGMYVVKIGTVSPDYRAKIEEQLGVIEQTLGVRFLIIEDTMDLVESAELREAVVNIMNDELGRVFEPETREPVGAIEVELAHN